MRNTAAAALILLIILLIASCESDGANPVIIEPTTTNDGGVWNFKTNSSSAYGQTNSSAFGPLSTGDYPMTMITRKISGSAYTGYGAKFAVQGDGSCYNLFINTNGQYRITSWEASGGGFNSTTITDWTSDTELSSGYDTGNTIVVDYDNTSHVYSFTFNGAGGGSFDADSQSLTLDWDTGQCGFTTEVGNSTQENFPDTLVWTQFEVTY